MARAELQKDFNSLMLKFRKEFSSGYLAPIGGESGTHIQLLIGGAELVGSFVKGTELLIEPSAGLSDIQKEFYKKYGTGATGAANWSKVTEQLIADAIKNGYFGVVPIKDLATIGANTDLFSQPDGIFYRKIDSMTLEATFFISNVKEADNLLGDIRNALLYDALRVFKDKVGHLAENDKALVSPGTRAFRRGEKDKEASTPGKPVYGQGRGTRANVVFGGGLKTEHNRELTRALLGLERAAKQGEVLGGATFKTPIEATKILDLILDEFDIDWEESVAKSGVGSYGVERLLKLQFGRNKILDTEYGKVFKEKASGIFKNLAKNEELLKGITQKASRTIKDQVIDDVVHDAVKKVKKVNKRNVKVRVTKGRAKKFKNNTRTENLKKRKKTKTTKSVAKAAAIKAKGFKKTKTTERKGKDSIGIGQLQLIINRKLADQVKKNMGRPALRNQTGRFADSVRLVAMRQAQNSIVGDYTYQLNPYETFENTGSRRWPTGYNPKPLITKSIRELAVQTLDTKFTLRRV